MNKSSIKHNWVDQYNGIKFMGYGKDHMKIIEGQQICPSIIEPSFFNHCLTFGTVPVPAGVIGNSFKTAMVTLLNMAAKLSSTTNLNLVHDL